MDKETAADAFIELHRLELTYAFWAAPAALAFLSAAGATLFLLNRFARNRIPVTAGAIAVLAAMAVSVTAIGGAVKVHKAEILMACSEALDQVARGEVEWVRRDYQQVLRVRCGEEAFAAAADAAESRLKVQGRFETIWRAADSSQEAGSRAEENL